MPRVTSVRIEPSQVWTNWRPKATMVVQNIDGKHWEYSILGPHSGIMLPPHMSRICQHDDRREGQQTYPGCEW
jgi:hypothetical protein